MDHAGVMRDARTGKAIEAEEAGGDGQEEEMRQCFLLSMQCSSLMRM